MKLKNVTLVTEDDKQNGLYLSSATTYFQVSKATHLLILYSLLGSFHDYDFVKGHSELNHFAIMPSDF